jgi:DNA-binding transcriptional ArsR family regulator
MPRPTRQFQIAALDEPLCEEGLIHVAAVRKARAASPDSDILASLSEFFSVIADPNRLRIVSALAESDLCVCDIAASVGLSESAVSHHLKLLRTAGLVRNRRDGRMVWYALDDDHVTAILAQARDHANHRIAGELL